MDDSSGWIGDILLKGTWTGCSAHQKRLMLQPKLRIRQHPILNLFLLACLGWIWPVCTQAQIKSWNHYLYTTKDGLPSDKVRNAVQDRDGFIWIATESGLCRFDGDAFERVLHDAKDSTSIPSDATNFVNILPDGRLLVSTMEGLFVMNTRTMRGVTLHFYTQKGWESYDDYIHNVEINTRLKKVIVLSSTAFSYFDFDLTHIETIPYRFPSDDVNKGRNLTNYAPLFLPNGDVLFMDNYSTAISRVDYQQKKIAPLKATSSHPY